MYFRHPVVIKPIENQANGSKSPQSAFDSCFAPPLVGQVGCAGLDGASNPPPIAGPEGTSGGLEKLGGFDGADEPKDGVKGVKDGAKDGVYDGCIAGCIGGVDAAGMDGVNEML